MNTEQSTCCRNEADIAQPLETREEKERADSVLELLDNNLEGTLLSRIMGNYWEKRWVWTCCATLLHLTIPVDWHESSGSPTSWSGQCSSGYPNTKQYFFFYFHGRPSPTGPRGAWAFLCFIHRSAGDPSWDSQGQFGADSWVRTWRGRREDTQFPSKCHSGEEEVQITWLLFFFSRPTVKTVAWSCVSQKTWKPCSLLKEHISYFNIPFDSSSLLRLVKFTPARLRVKLSSLNYIFLTLSQPFFSPYHPPLF